MFNVLEPTPMIDPCEQPFVENQDTCEVGFAYHDRTKHHFNRQARSLGYMDWANQPDLFRQFSGTRCSSCRWFATTVRSDRD